VHSFARMSYMLPFMPLPVPKLQSYQREVTPRSVLVGHYLSRGTLELTACSASCAKTGSVSGRWHVIYNCVDTARYDFRPEVAPDAPLMFLGRLERFKGPHTAIEVARRTGRKLIVAGNVPPGGPDVDYAREVIAQCDGKQIEYVGPVNDAQKNEMLGRSACMLMPIDWEEPFGIVMAEALACGTPVLGFARGSVPEVVEHGVTGFHCTDLDSMVAAVGRIPELKRSESRRAAEQRFSNDVIVGQYEALYLDLSRRVAGSQ
jgi:glycosyltransferase involved in cell wall biosynthesis